MKRKSLRQWAGWLVAIAAGVVLAVAQPAAGSVMYQESFDTNLGIWPNNNAAPYYFENTLGNPAGSAAVVHNHNASPVSDGSWEYWYSRPTAGNVFVAAETTDTVKLSYDFYQELSWTVYPYLMGWVYTTDNTTNWFAVTGTPAIGGWTNITQTLVYPGQVIASVELFQISAAVSDTEAVYINDLQLGFDNISVELVIPEPATATLLLVGGLILFRRRSPSDGGPGRHRK